MQRRYSDYRVANDRPHLDDKGLPIALLYHGFGHFLDIATGASTDLVLDIDQREFQMNVWGFTIIMNVYHATKEDRQFDVLRYLNKIFRCCLGDHTQDLVAGMVHREHHSDGHVLGSANTMEVVLEVKNELGSSGADPTVEISACYTQSLMDDSTREDLPCFRFPALGIVVIGSHIGFYALAFTGKTRLVALTPLLPTTAERGNNWSRPALLKAFKAASILRYHIHKDTKKFSKAKEESLPIQTNLPYVNQVAAYPPGAAGTSPGAIHFQIQFETYRTDPPSPDRLLYLAFRDGTRDPVIVKFTRQYCLELHLFCAQRYQAPQLLGYDTIPGGWHVVVMECIDQDDSNPFTYARDHLPTWSKDLKSLVNDFHDEGWVHGDLRAGNMLISYKEPERVMLVDFDWAGRVDDGPVYPHALLNDELVKPEHPGDFRITKEHDDNVLALTLDELARKLSARLGEVRIPQTYSI